MDKCYRYNIWCNTDSRFEVGYSESPDETSLPCPVNTAHAVDDAKLSIDAKLEREIQKHQQILTQDGLTSRPFGFPKVSCTAGQTTTHYFLISEAIALRGGFVETSNHVHGDYFDFDIEDKDGLYAPAGTVLSKYVKGWTARKSGLNELKDESISDPLPVNVYGRLKYTSTGGANVDLTLTLLGYK